MANNKTTNKHEFAVFIEKLELTAGSSDKKLTITNPDVIHRITVVLRLAVGDSLIIFDQTQHVRCAIDALSKKNVLLSVLARNKTLVLEPAVHWILPLLEREAFEAALYSLAAMGATSVTPVITSKSRHKWGTKKDYERAQRVMIAASEQAKQFMVPALKPVLNLEDALLKTSSKTSGERSQAGIFFDVAGEAAWEVVATLKNNNVQTIWCLIGPEGDLTDDEKKLVYKNSFCACRLTPTILRACDAVAVALGIIRSCL